MTFKEKVCAYYALNIQDKIDVFKDMISALTEDAKNDSKGSAGDKHETALSMMHLEQEKLNYKILENVAAKKAFDEINFGRKSDKVILGSLVQANSSFFLVSVALSKTIIDGQTVYGLSTESPLAKALLDQKVGHSFKINNSEYVINEII